nr:hypothetical protein [Leptospira sp.]
FGLYFLCSTGVLDCPKSSLTVYQSLSKNSQPLSDMPCHRNKSGKEASDNSGESCQCLTESKIPEFANEWELSKLVKLTLQITFLPLEVQNQKGFLSLAISDHSTSSLYFESHLHQESIKLRI